MGSAQQLKWNSEVPKGDRASEMLGKIVKNSSNISNLSPTHKINRVRGYGSLQRENSQRSEQPMFGNNSVNEEDFKALTMKKIDSSSPRRKSNPEQVRMDILNRLESNEKNFQKFMDSSKIMNLMDN